MTNPDIALNLADIAIELVHSQGDGTISGDAEVAKTLLDIVDKSIQAYNAHTGEEISLDLIRPEDPI